MAGRGSRIQRFSRELRRRRVLRSVGTYAVGMFVVLQAADIVLPAVGLSEAWLRVLVVAGGLGLPVTAVLAWVFDLTADGIVRTEPLALEAAEEGRASPRAANLGYIGVGILIAVFGLGTTARFFPDGVELHGSSDGDVARAYAATPPERRVAVLPFENLSSEDDDAYFAAGITEEITGRLSRVRGLLLIAPTSVARVTSQAGSSAEIGRALAVGRILRGSVRRSGARARIAVQLLDASTGVTVWAETYDRGLEDVFDVQAEVARTIAMALEVELTPGDRVSLEAGRATSTEAYELYLQGRFFWSRRTREGLERAIGLFGQALAIDPGFAPASAGMAEAFLLLPQYGSLPVTEAVPQARRAAEAALASDPTLASAHAALGFIFNNHDRDWPAAERAFRRAIELDPSYVTAHHWFALTLLFQGRADDAVAEIERAREIDPLSVIVASDAGVLLRLAGRPGDAVAALDQAVELDPSLGEAHVHLGLAALTLGDPERAAAELERAVTLTSRHPLAVAMAGAIRAERGDPEGSRAALEALERRSREGEFVSPALTGVLRGYAGDADAMFADLEQALDTRDLIFMTVLLDPVLRARFGSDSRWEDLLVRARGRSAGG